eukprot:COSAG02_NODE_203_length_29261_cov_20.960395_13_plen_120_part_00
MDKEQYSVLDNDDNDNDNHTSQLAAVRHTAKLAVKRGTLVATRLHIINAQATHSATQQHRTAPPLVNESSTSHSEHRCHHEVVPLRHCEQAPRSVWCWAVQRSAWWLLLLLHHCCQLVN